MIKITKKWIKEPLLHFLLLGAMIYVYFTIVHKEESFGNKLITLSSYEVQELKSSYEKEYERETNQVTLKILIAQKYYDAILLEKAFSTKIAHNDAVVAQRLLKKMQFVMLDSSKYKEPTQKELHDYYTKNIHEYSHIKKISFSSVFFRNDKDTRIASTYELLNVAKVNSVEARGFSDISALPYHVENASFKEIEESYGKYFAKKLFSLKQGVWHKAIQAKDGARLVYVTQKKTASPYAFDDVESRVYEDYLAQQAKEQKEKAYEEMAAQYSLKVE
jgi:hypothetical protein